MKLRLIPSLLFLCAFSYADEFLISTSPVIVPITKSQLMIPNKSEMNRAGVYDMGGKLFIDRNVEVSKGLRADRYLEMVSTAAPTPPSAGYARFYLSNSSNTLCAEYSNGGIGCFGFNSTTTTIISGAISAVDPLYYDIVTGTLTIGHVSLSTGVTGTLPDANLTSNVALKTSTQTFTGQNTFISSLTVQNTGLVLSTSTLQSGTTFFVSSGTANSLFVSSLTIRTQTVLPYLPNTVLITDANGVVTSTTAVLSSATINSGVAQQVAYYVNTGNVSGTTRLIIDNTGSAVDVISSVLKVNPGDLELDTAAGGYSKLHSQAGATSLDTINVPDISGTVTATMCLLESTQTFTAAKTFIGSTTVNYTLLANNSAGTSGQFLQSQGNNATPIWATSTGASVSSTNTWTGENYFIRPTSHTAILDMGSNKITNLANGTATTDAANYGQINYDLQESSQSRLNAPGFTTTSSAFSNTGSSGTITPTSTSSRIKITALGVVGLNSTTGSVAEVTIARGTTDLSSSGNGFCQLTNPANASNRITCHMTFIDSPATTSPTTYNVRLKSNDNTTTAAWTPATDSVVILEEIR